MLVSVRRLLTRGSNESQDIRVAQSEPIRLRVFITEVVSADGMQLYHNRMHCPTEHRCKRVCISKLNDDAAPALARHFA